MPTVEEINYEQLKDGETDPYLNRYIRVVIIHDQDYIVYLDDEFNTQWDFSSKRQWPKHMGAILSKVAILECRSDFMRRHSSLTVLLRTLFKSHKAVINNFIYDPALFRISSLLGESIARVFDGSKENSAYALLRQAETLIKAKNADYSRKWYFSYARFWGFFAAAGIFIIWQWKTKITACIGNTAFEVLFCSLFGVIGAFISMASRYNQIKLDAFAGKSIHHIEAAARLITGMAAAAMLVLAVISGFILSFLDNSGYKLAYSILISMLAGISERIIPNMVNKFEAEVTASPTRKLRQDRPS